MVGNYSEKTEEKNSIKRRSVLKSGVAAGASATILGSVSSSAAAEEDQIFDGPATEEIYKVVDGMLVIKKEFNKQATAEEIEVYEAQAETLNEMKAEGDFIIEQSNGEIILEPDQSFFSSLDCGVNDYEASPSLNWDCIGVKLTVMLDHETTQDVLTYDNTFIAIAGILGLAGGGIGAGATILAAALTVDEIENADQGCGFETDICIANANLPITNPPGDDITGGAESQQCCVDDDDDDDGGWWPF